MTEDSVNAWPRCLEDDCQVAFDLELHGTAPNWPRSPEKDRFPTVFFGSIFFIYGEYGDAKPPEKNLMCWTFVNICKHLLTVFSPWKLA